MTEPRKILAYLYKDEWYPGDEVQTKRAIDKDAFKNALPYTIIALRARRKKGNDVPEWIDLDKPADQNG